MGIFYFLPKVDRCCCCTRKLKIACLLIDIWSMFGVCHQFSTIFYPACKAQYDPSSGPMYGALNVFRWILFLVDICLLGSSFAYLLGILFSYPITADVFISFGIISAIFSLNYAIICAVQMYYSNCTDPSDVLSFTLYVLLWVYFIIIVNSYEDYGKV